MAASRRSESFAFDALALHFTSPADSLSGFAGAALRRFFVMTPQLHFPKHAFALQFLFERLQRLIDIVVTNENLHLAEYSLLAS